MKVKLLPGLFKSKRKAAKSDIPVGTQFSPDLIDLKSFVAVLAANSGDKGAMEAAVWVPPVRTSAPKKAPTRRRRSLPLEAARQYRLLDEKYRVTPLAKRLALLPAPQIYEEFARHVLMQCGGLRVVDGIRGMMRDGLEVAGDPLASYLSDQGFHVIVHNTAINSLRLWLERGGVFAPGTWTPNEEVIEKLTGVSRTEVGALVGLTEEQRAFVLALCRINPTGPTSAADVRALAEQILDRDIRRDSLPKRVLAALADAGYITYKTGGTGGGKAAVLETTAKFKSELLSEFLLNTAKTLDPVLTAYYATTPTDIYRDLESLSPVKRGKALEAYAVHIMRLMGFHFVGWRKRAAESTGNGEVDVVMSGLFGNSPTRWQVQCKNTKGSVDLEDVAKEVGLAPLTNATHILMIANTRFTKDAQTFANEVMKATPLTIVRLDGDDFAKVKKSPGTLASILRIKAHQMADLRRKTTMWGW